MKHLFLPYKLALIAKEKGFNEPCYEHYFKDGSITNNFKFSFTKMYEQYECEAPLYQQIIDWFRIKNKISIELSVGHDKNNIWWDAYIVKANYGLDYDELTNGIRNKNYYRALNKAIKEAFKLI